MLGVQNKAFLGALKAILVNGPVGGGGVVESLTQHTATHSTRGCGCMGGAYLNHQACVALATDTASISSTAKSPPLPLSRLSPGRRLHKKNAAAGHHACRWLLAGWWGCLRRATHVRGLAPCRPGRSDGPHLHTSRDSKARGGGDRKRGVQPTDGNAGR